jgi:hypothetical protein
MGSQEAPDGSWRGPSASWMGPPAESGDPPAAKTAGNPRQMKVLTDLVHETRSVNKSLSRHFLRYFFDVRMAVLSSIGDDGGSPPPLFRSPPRGPVDHSVRPVVVHLTPMVPSSSARWRSLPEGIA